MQKLIINSVEPKKIFIREFVEKE